MFQLC